MAGSEATAVIDINAIEVMHHARYGRANGWSCQHDGCRGPAFWYTGTYFDSFIHPHQPFDYQGMDSGMTMTEEFVPCCSLYHAKLYFAKQLAVKALLGEPLPVPPQKVQRHVEDWEMPRPVHPKDAIVEMNGCRYIVSDVWRDESQRRTVIEYERCE